MSISRPTEMDQNSLSGIQRHFGSQVFDTSDHSGALRANHQSTPIGSIRIHDNRSGSGTKRAIQKPNQRFCLIPFVHYVAGENPVPAFGSRRRVPPVQTKVSDGCGRVLLQVLRQKGGHVRMHIGGHGISPQVGRDERRKRQATPQLQNPPSGKRSPSLIPDPAAQAIPGGPKSTKVRTKLFQKVGASTPLQLHEHAIDGVFGVLNAVNAKPKITHGYLVNGSPIIHSPPDPENPIFFPEFQLFMGPIPRKDFLFGEKEGNHSRIEEFMADMPARSVQTRTAVITLRPDGIIEVRILPGNRQNLADAKENIAQAVALGGDQIRPFLVDIRESEMLEPEARHFYASTGLSGQFSALALLLRASPLGIMIGNVYARMAKHKIPMKLFVFESEATKWLLSSR